MKKFLILAALLAPVSAFAQGYQLPVLDLAPRTSAPPGVLTMWSDGTTNHIPLKIPGASVTTDDVARWSYQLNVKSDCGALGNGSADDSVAFQACANLIPASGGTIHVPSDSYVVNTAPSWGTKNVEWDFSPGAVITGTQTTFPRLATNAANIPVGPWYYSQSSQTPPSNGAVVALSTEISQPTGEAASVALYSGATSASSGNIWGFNPLITAQSGFSGAAYGIEVDVNSETTNSSSIVQGILITGSSSGDLQNAINVSMIGSSQWQSGLSIDHASNGVHISSTTPNGMIWLGNSGVFPGSLIMGEQIANGNDSIILQRATDTSPTGFFQRYVNSSNTSSIEWEDVNGNSFQAGYNFSSKVLDNNVDTQVTATSGVTLTANQIDGSAVIIRTGPTAAFTDTTDTAANIISGLSNPPTNSRFRLRVVNTTGYAETIAAGTGITISGTATISAGTWRDYDFAVTSSSAITMTNVGSGSQ